MNSRLSRTVRKRATYEVDRLDLDGLARERVEQALLDDEEWLNAVRAFEHAETAEDVRGRRLRDDDSVSHEERLDDVTRHNLSEAVHALEKAVQSRAEEVTTETVKDVEMYGHTVDLTQSTRLPCPACNERDFVDADGEPTTAQREAFFLGMAPPESGPEEVDHLAGWVCKHCGSTLDELLADGERVAIEVGVRGKHAPEPEESEDVATDGGTGTLRDAPEATWCSRCSRYRVDCRHRGGDR